MIVDKIGVIITIGIIGAIIALAANSESIKPVEVTKVPQVLVKTVNNTQEELPQIINKTIDNAETAIEENVPGITTQLENALDNAN